LFTGEQGLIKDLAETDIFAGLSSYHLEKIAEICTLRIYHAGEHCARQGTVTDELGIVDEGEFVVEIRIEVPPYTQTLNVATLTKGNVFAWSALVEPRVLTASIKCIGESRAYHIKASDLQRIFRESPSVEQVVMKNLAIVVSSRLRDSWRHMARLIAEMIKQAR